MFLKVKFGLFTVIKFSFFIMLLVRLLKEIRIGSELHDVPGGVLTNFQYGGVHATISLLTPKY